MRDDFRREFILVPGGWVGHVLLIKTLVSITVAALLLAPRLAAITAPQVESFSVMVKVDGGLEMPVDVYLPPNKNPAPVVLLAHGFNQSKKYHANHGRQLALAGYVVLIPSLRRFADHAGHGRDLLTLLDWAGRGNADPASQLHGRADAKRAAACGHSAGGLSALLAAAADRRIVTLVLLDAVDCQGVGAKAAAKLRIPTLSVCADPSQWNANGSPEQLAAALPEPKRIVRIAGASHLEAQDPVNRLGELVLGKADPRRQQRFSDEMIGWIKKHLPANPPPKSR